MAYVHGFPLLCVSATMFVTELFGNQEIVYSTYDTKVNTAVALGRPSFPSSVRTIVIIWISVVPRYPLVLEERFLSSTPRAPQLLFCYKVRLVDRPAHLESCPGTTTRYATL